MTDGRKTQNITLIIINMRIINFMTDGRTEGRNKPTCHGIFMPNSDCFMTDGQTKNKMLIIINEVEVPRLVGTDNPKTHHAPVGRGIKTIFLKF